MLTGRIVKNISNTYSVYANEKVYDCIPRGLFRKQKITPLVGDLVKIDEQNLSILEILPRKNMLARPSVANVDKALIVTSMVQPDYSSLLLDKEIAMILLANIQPVIFFTKLDLIDSKEEFFKIKAYYESIGIPVFDYDHLEEFKRNLKDSFVVLTGQSGAGKSTLLNQMKENLHLKTAEISKALNRGKHTTRHSEIFIIDSISFCDTPGFSSLDFHSFSREDLMTCFPEFQNYPCKFVDCSHVKETSCGVKKAVEDGSILVSRYESFLKIREEVGK